MIVLWDKRESTANVPLDTWLVSSDTSLQTIGRSGNVNQTLGTVPKAQNNKTRNPLKFAGLPQTRQRISAVSRPKFTILSGHLEEVLIFNKFFRLSIDALAPTIYPDKFVRWCQNGDLLRPVFSASILSSY